MTKMTRVDLGHLGDWIETSLQGGGGITFSALHSLDALLAVFVERSGLFRKVGTLEHIGCPRCEQSHMCRVEREDGSRSKAHCLMNGWFDVDAAEVNLFGFDRARLLELIGVSFGLHKLRIRRLSEGRLVQIGLVTGFGGTRDFLLGYADGLAGEAALASVIQSLNTDYGKGPGIILTPSRISESYLLPGKHKLLSLDRAFSGCGSGFEPIVSVFEERLGERVAVKLRPGPKGQKRISYEVWQAEHVKTNWPSTRADQAQRIADNWPAKTPREIDLVTIQNHLPEFESGRYPRSTN